MTKKIQQNLILLLLLSGGILFVYLKYLIGPLNAKYDQTVQNIQQTESKLNEMRRRALELPRLQADMKLLEQEVTDLEKLLPRDKEVPELLRTITKSAQRYQLKISVFAPSGISTQANYNEVLFQINLQGTYHALAHFLAELGQQPRILSVRNVNFAATPSTKENMSTVNVTFMLVAYTFKE
jgi:type IV pilus assembly protein PilO